MLGVNVNKFTTVPLQVKVKVVALYCYYIFGVVFLSLNLSTKASPHLLHYQLVSFLVKCIVRLFEAS